MRALMPSGKVVAYTMGRVCYDVEGSPGQPWGRGIDLTALAATPDGVPNRCCDFSLVVGGSRYD